MASDRETIIQELRALAQQGSTPAEVGTWLVRELGMAENREFQLVRYMRDAFKVPLKPLKLAYDWVGLGHGGKLTNDELNQLLGPLVPRSDDR